MTRRTELKAASTHRKTGGAEPGAEPYDEAASGTQFQNTSCEQERPYIRTVSFLLLREILLTAATALEPVTRVVPESLESRWSPKAQFPGFGVQLASKLGGDKSLVLSKQCL